MRLKWFFIPVILTIFLYSYLIEPNWIEVNRIYIKGSKRAKMIFLSDLHLTKIGFRERKVINIIKEEKPDFVVITGDIIEEEKHKDIAKKFFREIEKYSTVIVVNGNHDPDLSFLISNKTIVLTNKIYNNSLCFVGLEYQNPNFSLLKKDCILLYHSPEIIDKVRGRVFLALFGHTHGGQVKVPLVGPIYVPLPLKYWKYSEGLFYENGTYIYVTRGLGVYSKFPFRLFCRPEIVIIEMI